MSTKNLVIKQSVKYVLIIIVFFFALALSRIVWNQSLTFLWWLFGVTGTIIVIMIILDLASLNDVIPIFKK